MNKPLACVIGDLSLVRALGRAGVPVLAVGFDADSALFYSRYCRERLLLPSLLREPDAALAMLCELAGHLRQPPVLFYQGDHDLLFVSRNRNVLKESFRLLLPPVEIVESTVDKLRFAQLARQLHLPVPATLPVSRGANMAEALREWRHYPAVLKPSTRVFWFGSRLQQQAIGSNQKAIRLDKSSQLEKLLPLLEEHATDFVLQALIEGGEERIVSYHAYVRPGGELVAEFTGRKIRTSPRAFGLSSCVEITDEADLKHLGRHVLEQLGFSGVVKLDFKRDHRQHLHLLEVNPRFNLWHHPAAKAGVNLPYLVYQDLLEPGSAPLLCKPVHTGVVWMSARQDARALGEYRRAGELTLGRWLWQLARADINEDMHLADPLPGIVDLAHTVGRKMARLGSAAKAVLPRGMGSLGTEAS